MSKWATGAIEGLAVAFRNNTFKRKVNSHKECYNCYKLDHFGKNYPQPDKRLQRLTHNDFY